jgi:deazaflavin-dependent oxidoreductase (nitroreductase family)
MIVAMLVGMAVLGAAVSVVFTLIGHSNVLHYAGLRGLLMSAYMTVGMSLWMRHRGHGWSSVGEMAVAMFVPYALLIGPFAAGLIPPSAFLGAMHALMIPAMVVVMLRRREEYSRDHRAHTSDRVTALPRAFARFNRHFANPVVRLVAGWLPPFAIVSHTGRSSGRSYRTPVIAFSNGDSLVFSLVYGEASDWVKNVQSAGEATVSRLGHSTRYVQPELSSSRAAREWLSPIVRVPIRLLGADLMRIQRSAA